MPSSTTRIKESAVIYADMDQHPSEAWDAGAFRELSIFFRVLKAGTAGILRLQHAAINRDDAYIDLAGASVNLNVTGDTFVHVTAFLRFVRWRVDSGVAGDPVALADAVGKN